MMETLFSMFDDQCSKTTEKYLQSTFIQSTMFRFKSSSQKQSAESSSSSSDDDHDNTIVKPTPVVAASSSSLSSSSPLHHQRPESPTSQQKNAKRLQFRNIMESIKDQIKYAKTAGEEDDDEEEAEEEEEESDMDSSDDDDDDEDEGETFNAKMSILRSRQSSRRKEEEPKRPPPPSPPPQTQTQTLPTAPPAAAGSRRAAAKAAISSLWSSSKAKVKAATTSAFGSTVIKTEEEQSATRGEIVQPEPTEGYPRPAVMIKLPSQKESASNIGKTIRRMKEWKWRLVTMTEKNVAEPSLIYTDLTHGDIKGSFPLSQITQADPVSAEFMKNHGSPKGMEMKGWKLVAAGREYIFATEKQDTRNEYVQWIQTKYLCDGDGKEMEEKKDEKNSKFGLAVAKRAAANNNDDDTNTREKAESPETLPHFLQEVRERGGVPLDIVKLLKEQRIDDEETLLMLGKEEVTSLGLPLGPKMKLLAYINMRKKEIDQITQNTNNNKNTSNIMTQQQQQSSSSLLSDNSDPALEEMMKKISEKFPRTLVIQPSEVEIFFDCRLGSGGYASVFEGSMHQGKPVAAKVFDRAEDGFEECARMCQLHHRNIVSVVGVTASLRKSRHHQRKRSKNNNENNDDDNEKHRNKFPALMNLTSQVRFIMLLELAEGSLADVINCASISSPNSNPSNSSNTFTSDVILHFAIQIADGLRYLHSRDQKVYHMDLKENNVLVFGTTLKLTDFGISKSSHATNTQVTSAKGTLYYVAPELEQKNVAATNDCYAFGIILLHLLTLKSPGELVREYHQPSSSSSSLPPTTSQLPKFFQTVLEKEMTSASSCTTTSRICPSFKNGDHFLVRLCKKCLSFDPLDRPRDGIALYNELVIGASTTMSTSSMLVMGMFPSVSHHSSSGTEGNGDTTSGSVTSTTTDQNKNNNTGGVGLTSTKVVSFETTGFQF